MYSVESIPPNSECKNPLEKFSPRFFLGSRRHPPRWLSFKGPNYQIRVLLISAGANEGHFAGKNQWGLVLARQCSGSPGTCNPEETGLPVLSSTPFFGSGPVGLPPVPLTEKTFEKFAIFRPTSYLLLKFKLLCLWRQSSRAVVPKVCFADPKGSATSSQGTSGYISVMGTFQFTYFFNQRNNVLLIIIEILL